jgi:hypothetical protein
MADPSSRPCFVPLPSLGYLSLQSLASQRSRTRLRVACSLAVIPARPARAGAAVSPRVSPTPSPSPGPLPVSPRGYGSPFGAPSMVGSPPGDRWTARSGLAPDHADHPLRSLVPPAKLAAEPRRVSPTGAALLSWAFRPSRASSIRSWDPLADPPHPRSAARTAHDRSRTARDVGDLATPGSGEPGRAPTSRRTPGQLVGGHRSGVDRAVPPSRRQSFSRGLHSTRRRPRVSLALGASK